MPSCLFLSQFYGTAAKTSPGKSNLITFFFVHDSKTIRLKYDTHISEKKLKSWYFWLIMTKSWQLSKNLTSQCFHLSQSSAAWVQSLESVCECFICWPYIIDSSFIKAILRSPFNKNIPLCLPLACQRSQFKSIFITERSVLTLGPVQEVWFGPTFRQALSWPHGLLMCVRIKRAFPWTSQPPCSTILLKRFKDCNMRINHGAFETLPGGTEPIPAFNKQEQTETFFLKILLLSFSSSVFHIFLCLLSISILFVLVLDYVWCVARNACLLCFMTAIFQIFNLNLLFVM